jgi:D-glycero-D-manno-heptose 1,7-bisphosphate phosphatase
MQRALFIDRDGVINHLVFYASHGEWEAPRNVTDLRLLDEAIPALRQAQRAGWLLFLITNQPSYAKGKCPLEDLEEVHREVLARLESGAVVITESFVCYHHPESQIPGYGSCRCRKPSPWFITEAAKHHDLDLSRSWIVGDQDTDIQTGHRAGCRTALIEYEHSQGKRGMVEPDLVCANLAALVQSVG